MANLVIICVVLFAFQGAELSEPNTFLEKTPEHIARLIETDTREFVHFLESHGYNYEVESSIKHYVERVQSIVGKLQLKSHIKNGRLELTLDELTEKLRKILQILQNPKLAVEDDFPRYLLEIASIFEKLADYTKTGEQSIELHQLLQNLLFEYCFTIKNAVRMLTSPGTMHPSPLKMRIESDLKEIMDNLEHVDFDNVHVKRTVIDMLHNYVRGLEKTIPKEVLEHFEVFLRRCEGMSALECRRELTTAFDSLRTAIKGHEFDQNLLMQLLAATYVLEFKIYNMCVTNVPHGETTTSFGLQIRTVSNGVINTLKSLSFEDKHARQILIDQTHELIVNLNSINQKLDTVHLAPVQIVKGELNRIIAELIRVVESFHNMEEEEIKTTLTKCFQVGTTQIEKLLRVEHENKDPQTSPLYEIFNDYLAILQHQLIQFQNIYQSTTEKQPITHMGNQIQTITNSVIVYLRNVPTNDVMIREKLEVQVHHLIKRVQAILVRVKDINDPNFVKIIKRISKITEAFESFMERTKISAINEVVFHFNILVQQIAVEMKNLAWLGQNAKLEDVVRSVMGEYLIIIENIQVKIQRINQVAQVGQSPRELALQIEVVAEHLRQMLVVFVSDNPLARRTFMWEIRHFEQVLETVADQLLSKEVSQSGKVYKEVGSNLKQVVTELRKSEKDTESADIYQYRMRVVNKIVNVAEEVQRLCWISQADIQEGLGVQTTYVRSILLELLLSLQNFHIQMMHNFQVVASGQSPAKILAEIEQIPKTLFGQLQAIKSEIDLEQILTIQLGEYLQTIENTLNSMHHEMKNNGEHNVEIEKIADMLGKMSLLLQNVNVKDVKEYWTKFELSLNEFIQGMHTLVAMNFEKVSKTHIGTHTGVILHGVLSNMLATLRNMYIQLYYSQHGTEATKINELGDRIAVITNNIMPTVETIVGSTTPIKQALDVQIFKYSRNLKYLINKIDKELGESNIKEVKEVQTKLRLSLTILQQTASSMTTLTINDLKLHFNKLIQGVGAEIQKLVILQTTNKETHDVIRHLLLHYLKTLKNVHIQIQNISRMSHQSENYQLVAMQIDTAIIELCKFLQVLPQNHKLLAKVIVVESHEMAQLILNIINRYQAAAVVQDNDLFMEIATELKKIQLFLQDLNESKVLNDFNNFIVKLASHMERAAVLIEQLMWMPVKTVHGAQYRPDMPTFVRVTLHDFLSAVQNMFVQIANVIVHVNDKSFDEIVNGKTHENAQNVMEMPESGILYRPELELYKDLVKKESPMITNQRNKWNVREYEHLTMPDSHRIPYTSSWPRNYQNGMMPSGYNYQPMMNTPWYYPQMTPSTYGPNMMYQLPSNTMVNQRNWWYPAAPTQYYPEMMMSNRGMHQPTYYTETKTMYQHQPEPKQVAENIQTITKKIANTLMNTPIAKDTILTQIRQLTTVLEEISRKMQVEQIADNLRNLKLAFDNILKRSTITNLDQMKTEICHNLEMVSKQFEDLVKIHEMRTSTLVNTVLERYNNHLQMTWRDLQNYSIYQKY